jgi:collagen type I/II/III/V/XI/XXIV/XXVII alpha
MSRIFSGTYSAGYTLSAGPDANPVTIDSTGLFQGGFYAANYPATDWTITNAGSILGAGIALASAGTVSNTGAITGNAAPGYGVDLRAGGSVTNANGGTISGYSTGVYVSNAAGTVVNDGSIAGGLLAGVALDEGGQVTNQAAGIITGYGFATGVGIFDAAGTADNFGIITASFQSAVLLDNGGAVTNETGGTITGTAGNYGGVDGVAIYNATGSVTNFGLIDSAGGSAIYIAIDGHVTNQGMVSGQNAGVILGTAGTVVNDGTISGGNAAYGGIVLKSGGQITNRSDGTITGYSGADGVNVQVAAATVTNAGHIVSGTGSAIVLADGGSVTNDSTGIISGDEDGVAFGTNASTLINAGSIAGATDAIQFAAGFANRLVADPGASFSGTVDGGNTIGAAVISTLELAPGSGTLSGLGTAIVNFGSVAFDPGASWFLEGSAPGLGSTITGFVRGDTIEVDGITVTGSSYAGTTLTLTDTAGQVSLDLPGPFTTGNFVVTNVAGGAEISVACFRSGTSIRTPGGEVAVEDLREGDLVETLIGGTPVPVIWIGHRTLICARHPRPEQVWPICIAADAFGHQAPSRDLFLSGDHAVYVDGVLIPVRQLVNGTSIRRVPVEQVTWFHVELARHDVILAEGLAAESYLDTGNRAMFENAGAPLLLHPDFALENSQARREAESCARFVSTPAMVEPIWRRLAKCAEDRGYSPPIVTATGDPAVRLVVDGIVYLPASGVDGVYAFIVPRPPHRARLLSNTAAPAFDQPWLGDSRQLGLAVKRISIRSGAAILDLALDDPRLVDGWWDVEQAHAATWRWTNGDAELPAGFAAASGISFPAVIEIKAGTMPRYPVTARQAA